MLRILKTTALSAMIAAGALSAVTAGAQAEGLYPNFGDGARAGFHFGDEGRRHGDRWREQGWRRGCSAERALDKADRMGLHRVRIVDVDRRTITVAGRQHGDRVTVTFGRGPHCPVLGY